MDKTPPKPEGQQSQENAMLSWHSDPKHTHVDRATYPEEEVVNRGGGQLIQKRIQNFDPQKKFKKLSRKQILWRPYP